MFDTWDMQKAVRSATTDEINEMRFAFFAGLRLGLEETDRMDYDETHDEAYKLLCKSERALTDAMAILKQRPDPILRQRQADLASR